MSAAPEITVQELAQKLAQIDAVPFVQLIDVREPEEAALAHIEGFDILPLSQFPLWSETIFQRYDPEAQTLVLCHHGVRSQQMCQWLRQIGFKQVSNIRGGIDAYSRLVDANIPQY
ncbi:MAG: rhodanese-like domain-containing protein [Cyanobacteriota bacterium]|nr:rhodanese-like domain-containing protein [Cyanobacteriota bacterium]